mmetsp:Transcript_20072/g.30771  ORF Transcript_20072/g.30771 Transcript_20072/m.30771 type:complete len:630 (+) Transcript_20072:220-2109(+)|eukprot:CAMPEP_0196814300 /NCGR_PEP_ID=MMETSP1362-20130617/42512_1 /TAXON_ID=163516 /ORGANISM="Leptocylindrus danicus, Strain CCMP1856" /LENGTH=629 /DNA_ID=CAMNT_0042190869 /DNA_START=212 /DNA_END=2101 /DNA_ORIENTATION=-
MTTEVGSKSVALVSSQHELMSVKSDATHSTYSFAECSSVQEILEVMRLDIDYVASTQLRCVFALIQWTESTPDEIGAVRELGGICTIFDTMQHFTDDHKMQEAVIVLMVNLSATSVENRDEIGNVGGIPIVVGAMKKYLKTAGIQEYGCWFLRNMACSMEEVAHIYAIRVTGGINAIISAMEQHSKVRRIQEQACGALSNLSNDPINADLICEANGIRALSFAMKNHGESPAIQVAVCSTLANISVDDSKTIDDIEDTNCILLVITAMKKYHQLSHVQEYACLTLQNLCADDGDVCRDSLFELGGVPVILNAMKEHSNNASVQAIACLLLSKLSMGNMPGKELISRNGGILLILDSIDRYQSEQQVIQCACSALAELSECSRNNVRLIAESGGISKLIYTLEKNRNDSEIQELILSILVNVSIYSQPCFMILDACGISHILATMEHHNQDLQIVLRSCEALRNLCHGKAEIVKEVLDGNGIATIVGAMTCFSHLPLVQERSCETLTNISLDGTAAIDALVQGNVVQVVVAALKNHPHEVRVQVSGCSVLLNLSLDEEKVIAVATLIQGCNGKAVLEDTRVNFTEECFEMATTILSNIENAFNAMEPEDTKSRGGVFSGYGFCRRRLPCT